MRERGPSPLQDILSFRGFCARIDHPFEPTPPALPTLLQYYYTNIAQYTPPPPPPILVYAIHHTILGMAKSCEKQQRPQLSYKRRWRLRAYMLNTRSDYKKRWYSILI